MTSRVQPLQSLSVIVPLYNVLTNRGITVLEATFQSIEASLQYCRDKYPQGQKISMEVIVVDDGSEDGTLKAVEELCRQQSHYQLIKLPQNSGTAAARNWGVKFSQGQALFFCDGDDRFLPEHIFLGFSVLQQAIPASYQTTDEPEYFGAVRTGIYTQETLHPHWQKALENSIPLNLCVRREVHEFIQGFPEDDVFREFKYGTEDIAYGTWLQTFCHVARLERKTVEYICYPGSFFARQLSKFQAPPGMVSDQLSPLEQSQQQEIERIIQDRLAVLRAKL